MNWLKKLAGVTPTLAKVLGGPVGSVAIDVLAKALKVEPTETALEAKVNALTAADLIALKSAEMQFAKDMKQLDLDFEKVDAEDRANARAREIALKDWMPKALTLIVFALFSYVVWSLIHSSVPLENRDAFNQILGILYAAVTGVLGYYFGSSAGSRAKDTTIHSIKAGEKR